MQDYEVDSRGHRGLYIPIEWPILTSGEQGSQHRHMRPRCPFEDLWTQWPRKECLYALTRQAGYGKLNLLLGSDGASFDSMESFCYV